MYTVLDYLGVELTTADGKTKRATTGLISSYTNKFGKSGTPVSKYNYTYDEWGNITKIEETVSSTTRTYAYNEYSEVTNAEETYRDGSKYTYSYCQ